MAVDPYIARGVQPIDVTNSMMQGAGLQLEQQRANAFDQRNAMLDQRWQQENQQQQDAEKTKREMGFVYARAKEGDQSAVQYALGKFSEDPGFAQFVQQNPDKALPTTMRALEQILGIEPEQAAPGPIQFKKTPWGGQYAEQDGQRVPGLEYNPPAPQQYGPESFSPFTQADGTVVLLGSRGTQRPTSLKGAPKSAPLTTAQSAVDKSFAPEYAKFVTGGAADAQKALEELSGVHSQLKGGKKNLTGPVLGRVPLESRAMVNQDSVDAEETVANTVQRSLRVILGAQFTQKEGEALIRRAYNPQLSEAKNAERVGRLVTQLQRSLKAKQEAAQYYEQNGTLVGYQGKTDFSLSDFNVDGSASGGTGGWSIEEVP